MDPVSVFNALHDTKIIKFGRFNLKSGLVAPYYINLRRLPLYPELMEAVVTQVVERFLTNHALSGTLSQLQRQRSLKATDLIGKQIKEMRLKAGEEPAGDGADSDSQLGEEDASEVSSNGSDWETLGADHQHHQLDLIISGVPYGAAPIASAIAFKSRLPFLFQRKEPKEYGDHRPLMEDFNDETRNVFGKADEEGQHDKRQPTVILVEDVICSGESILESVRELEKQDLKVEFVICIIDREENGINLLLKQAGIQVISLYKISAVLRVLEATGRITSKQFITTRQWIDENQFQAIGVDPSQTIAPAAQDVALDASRMIDVTSN